MGSACTLPVCDSLPVARKWQSKSRSAKHVTTHNGQKAPLISSSRVSRALLYSRAEPPSTEKIMAGSSRDVVVPPWMRDHHLLLYNGVLTAEDSSTKSSSSSSPRTAAGDAAGQAGAGKDVVVEMFHGFFALAEYQRVRRQLQQTYPF